MSSTRILKLLSLAAVFCMVAPAIPAQQPAQGHDQHGQAKERTKTSDLGSSTLKEADRKFLQRAVASNQMEIEVSQMAVQKATNQDVKAFAQKLVDDHTNALQQLQTLAQSKGVQMQESMKKSDRLNGMSSGPEFDRAFMTQQVRHHQKDVAEFERQANSNGDPEVRALAAKLLPALREHLERARTVSSEASSSTGSAGGSNPADRPDTDGRKK